MDAFEGIHRVHISSSPPPSVSSGRSYEVVRSGRSGIAVYSSATFFGTHGATARATPSRRRPEEVCAVGHWRTVPVLLRVSAGGQSLCYSRMAVVNPTHILPLNPFLGRGGVAVRAATQVTEHQPLTDPPADNKALIFQQGLQTRLVNLDPEPEPEPHMEGGGRGHGDSTTDLSRHRSASLEIREKEIREKGSEILREQLDAAKRELKLKDKECERLAQVRHQLEQEMEELTASLFEEAHKMVRDANVKQAAAEKQLKEAQGKIDVLTAEVTALKALVLTSTPASPNRQLHPQLQASTTRGAHKHFGHSRNKSTGGVSSQTNGKTNQPSASPQPAAKEDREMDSVLYAEFLMWKEQPGLERTSAFLSRIHKEDIGPCLSFTRSELSQMVQSAVENNSLTIELVAMSALPTVKAPALDCGGPNGFRAAIETNCALSGLPRMCRHRIKLGDKGKYYYISPSSRARITAVCNFFTYIRYIQQGLVRNNSEQMFWEVMRLRKEMSVAKLGFYVTDQG